MIITAATLLVYKRFPLLQENLAYEPSFLVS